MTQPCARCAAARAKMPAAIRARLEALEAWRAKRRALREQAKGKAVK